MQMLIAQPIVQITLEYLSKQPYKEVAGLIMELQKLVPYVPPKLVPKPVPIKEDSTPKDKPMNFVA